MHVYVHSIHVHVCNKIYYDANQELTENGRYRVVQNGNCIHGWSRKFEYKEGFTQYDVLFFFYKISQQAKTLYEILNTI